MPLSANQVSGNTFFVFISIDLDRWLREFGLFKAEQ